MSIKMVAKAKKTLTSYSGKIDLLQEQLKGLDPVKADNSIELALKCEMALLRIHQSLTASGIEDSIMELDTFATILPLVKEYEEDGNLVMQEKVFEAKDEAKRAFVS